MTTAFVNFGQTDGFGIPGRENDRAGKMREIFMTDGNSIIAEAKDPYGHWFLRYKEGKTPDELKNASFTTAYFAIQFVEQWLNANRYNTKISDTKVEIPEIKYKKEK